MVVLTSHSSWRCETAMARFLRRGREEGFTLVELMIVIAILGIITLPISNLVFEGFKYYATTQTRLADSHDVQITTAYFSQDVADAGVRHYTAANPTTGTPVQSVWIGGAHPSGAYCGQGVAGTLILLLEWDDVQVGSTGASVTRFVDSVAYVATTANGKTNLVRKFCQGTDGQTGVADAVPSSVGVVATMAHNYYFPDASNAAPVSCAPSCAPAGAFPSSISFTLSVKGPTDTNPVHVTLTGTGRQS